jgi:hypothetical protein
MSPTNASKWALLIEMAPRACFPEDTDVSNAMRIAVELAGRQPASMGAFVAAM